MLQSEKAEISRRVQSMPSCCRFTKEEAARYEERRRSPEKARQRAEANASELARSFKAERRLMEARVRARAPLSLEVPLQTAKTLARLPGAVAHMDLPVEAADEAPDPRADVALDPKLPENAGALEASPMAVAAEASGETGELPEDARERKASPADAVDGTAAEAAGKPPDGTAENAPGKEQPGEPGAVLGSPTEPAAVEQASQPGPAGAPSPIPEPSESAERNAEQAVEEAGAAKEQRAAEGNREISLEADPDAPDKQEEASDAGPQLVTFWSPPPSPQGMGQPPDYDFWLFHRRRRQRAQLLGISACP